MQGVASCDCAIATSGSSTWRAPTDAAAVSELQIIKTVVSHTHTHTFSAIIMRAIGTQFIVMISCHKFVCLFVCLSDLL